MGRPPCDNDGKVDCMDNWCTRWVAASRRSCSCHELSSVAFTSRSCFKLGSGSEGAESAEADDESDSGSDDDNDDMSDVLTEAEDDEEDDDMFFTSCSNRISSSRQTFTHSISASSAEYSRSSSARNASVTWSISNADR